MRIESEIFINVLTQCPFFSLFFLTCQQVPLEQHASPGKGLSKEQRHGPHIQCKYLPASEA